MKRALKNAAVPKSASMHRLPTGSHIGNKACIDELRYLLKEAESGDTVGLAYVTMSAQKSYYVDSVGEAEKNPTFTLGMIAILKDSLIEKIKNR
jgi:hypothetical protein